MARGSRGAPEGLGAFTLQHAVYTTLDPNAYCSARVRTPPRSVFQTKDLLSALIVLSIMGRLNIPSNGIESRRNMSKLAPTLGHPYDSPCMLDSRCAMLSIPF